MKAWIASITRLPSENTTARMRAWRSLKASGAAVLRDGVYLMLDRETCRNPWRRSRRMYAPRTEPRWSCASRSPMTATLRGRVSFEVQLASCIFDGLLASFEKGPKS